MPKEFGASNSGRERDGLPKQNRLIRPDGPENPLPIRQPKQISASDGGAGQVSKENFSIRASTKGEKDTAQSAPQVTEIPRKDSPSSEKTVFTRETETPVEKLKEVRQKFKKDAASGQLSGFFSNIITETREKDPEASIVTLYRNVANSLPDKIDSTFQKKTLEEMSSQDPKIKKSAEQNFLFMNAKGILSAIGPDLTGSAAHDEDIIQTAVTTIYENKANINPEKPIQLQIRNLLRGGNYTSEIVAAVDNIQKSWIHDNKLGKIITTVDDDIEKNGSLSSSQLDGLAERLTTTTGYEKDQLNDFIERRHASAVGEKDENAGDVTTETVMTHAFIEEVGKVLKEMPENQRKVIQLRYGNDMNSPEIQEAAGLTEGQVRQAEHTAHHKLRHEFDKERRQAFDPYVRKYEI